MFGCLLLWSMPYEKPSGYTDFFKRLAYKKGKQVVQHLAKRAADRVIEYTRGQKRKADTSAPQSSMPKRRYGKARPRNSIQRARRNAGRARFGTTTTRIDFRNAAYRPRRPSRRYRRFVRKVRNIGVKNTGLQVQLFNQAFNMNSSADAQGSQVCYIFGGSTGGANTDQAADMYNLWTNFGLDFGLQKNTKVYFGHCRMDIKIHCSTNENIANYIDVYKFKCKRRSTSTVQSELATAWNDQAVPAVGNNIGETTLGSEPYDSSSMARLFDIKKVGRYQMPPGSDISLTYKVKINRFMGDNIWSDLSAYPMIGGWTQGYLFINWGAPLDANGAQSLATTSDMTCSFTRCYHFRLVEEKVSKAGHVDTPRPTP